MPKKNFPKPGMMLELKEVPASPGHAQQPMHIDDEKQFLVELEDAIGKNYFLTFTALLNLEGYKNDLLIRGKAALLKKILLLRNIRFITFVLNKGLDPTTEIEHDALKAIYKGDIKNHSILLFAARYGQNSDLIIYLLEATLAQSDPEIRQKIINHAFIAVITNPTLPNPATLVQKLIENFHADVKYSFPLAYAIQRPSGIDAEEKGSSAAEIVKVLLASGADINARIGHFRRLLIFYIVEKPEGSIAAVQAFLEYGSYQNVRRLFRENKLNEVRALLLHGLYEIKEQCRNSTPPIELPSDNPNDFKNPLLRKLITLIEAKKINLIACARDSEDLANGLLHDTPNKDFTELLLRAGVPVEGRNRHGQTPFTKNRESEKIFRAAQEYIAFHLEIKYGKAIDFSDNQVRQYLQQLAEIVAPPTPAELFQPPPLTPESQQQQAQGSNYSQSSQEVALQIKSARQQLIDSIPAFIQRGNHKPAEVARVTDLPPEIISKIEEFSSQTPYCPEQHTRAAQKTVAIARAARNQHAGVKRKKSSPTSVVGIGGGSSGFFAKEREKEKQPVGSQPMQTDEPIKPAAAAAAAAAAANIGNPNDDAPASSASSNPSKKGLRRMDSNPPAGNAARVEAAIDDKTIRQEDEKRSPHVAGIQRTRSNAKNAASSGAASSAAFWRKSQDREQKRPDGGQEAMQTNDKPLRPTAAAAAPRADEVVRPLRKRVPRIG